MSSISVLNSERVIESPFTLEEKSFHMEYKMNNILGKGGFGTVYSGIRRVDQMEVAIKQVYRDKVEDWDILHGKKLPLELSLLYQVQSVRGVIQLLEYYEEKDFFIYVMEKLKPSMDLFDFITENGRLHEDTARNFFHQIVDTAIACNKKGIIHLDIKDENIVVDLDTFNVKLIDFGSGKYATDNVYTNFNGTKMYSPPEWIQHRKYHGLPATVWSLGILLYLMVCEDVPFQKEHEICDAKVVFKRSDLSTDCKDLINQCLRRCSHERIHLNDIPKHPWVLLPSRKDASYTWSLTERGNTVSGYNGSCSVVKRKLFTCD